MEIDLKISPNGEATAINPVSPIEIIIEGDEIFFSWNDNIIQWMAMELGEVEFSEPRPCG